MANTLMTEGNLALAWQRDIPDLSPDPLPWMAQEVDQHLYIAGVGLQEINPTTGDTLFAARARTGYRHKGLYPSRPEVIGRHACSLFMVGTSDYNLMTEVPVLFRTNLETNSTKWMDIQHPYFSMFKPKGRELAHIAVHEGRVYFIANQEPHIVIDWEGRQISSIDNVPVAVPEKRKTTLDTENEGLPRDGCALGNYWFMGEVRDGGLAGRLDVSHEGRDIGSVILPTNPKVTVISVIDDAVYLSRGSELARVNINGRHNI